MTDCYIYTRVSTSKQVKEGNGLDSQLIRCLNYAKDKLKDVNKNVKEHTKGYKKVGIYYEDELFIRKDQDIQIEADHRTFFDHCLVNEKNQFIKNSTALVYVLRLIS